MERGTVGRNNAKSLWRECGKWSMVRVVSVKEVNVEHAALTFACMLQTSFNYCDWPLTISFPDMF